MFSTEKELVNSLKNNILKICDWDENLYNTQVIEEVNIGYGIADLVISKLKKDTEVYNEFTRLDIAVYKIIESNSNVNFEIIHDITRTNKRDLKCAIDNLIQESVICELDSLFVVKKSIKSVALKNIAIEAKLKNWRRALEQAHRYRWFANLSYVVLDSKHIKPAKENISKFHLFNVGLAEISITGKVKIHFKPKYSKPLDDKMWLEYSELLKSYL